MEFAGLVWERPSAWWGLLVPLAILIIARRPLRPQLLATGALGLWRRVVASTEGSGGERPQIPPGLWWLCAGLVVGVLALAGPRGRVPGAVRTWSILVDRSPGSYLPVEVGGETRLARGVALLEEEWRGKLWDGDRVRWFDGAEWIAGEEFPESWWEEPRAPRAAPAWERWDAPGVVWLCGRAPEALRRAASLCASGGEAAPGPVAVEGGDRLDWSAAGLVRVAGGAARRGVRVVGVAGALAEFMEVWAAERGLHLHGGAEEDGDVLFVSHAGEVVGASGRDPGWPEARSGWIALRAGEGSLMSGDSAAFALRWSVRLDEACLPAAGLSPASARAPIGKAMWIAGEVPDERRDGGPPGRAWEGWMALLSCGLVAVALLGYAR